MKKKSALFAVACFITMQAFSQTETKSLVEGKTFLISFSRQQQDNQNNGNSSSNVNEQTAGANGQLSQNTVQTTTGTGYTGKDESSGTLSNQRVNNNSPKNNVKDPANDGANMGSSASGNSNAGNDASGSNPAKQNAGNAPINNRSTGGSAGNANVNGGGGASGAGGSGSGGNGYGGNPNTGRSAENNSNANQNTAGNPNATGTGSSSGTTAGNPGNSNRSNAQISGTTTQDSRSGEYGSGSGVQAGSGNSGQYDTHGNKYDQEGGKAHENNGSDNVNMSMYEQLPSDHETRMRFMNNSITLDLMGKKIACPYTSTTDSKTVAFSSRCTGQDKVTTVINGSVRGDKISGTYTYMLPGNRTVNYNFTGNAEAMVPDTKSTGDK